jgi:hypothetical protein
MGRRRFQLSLATGGRYDTSAIRGGVTTAGRSTADVTIPRSRRQSMIVWGALHHRGRSLRRWGGYDPVP